MRLSLKSYTAPATGAAAAKAACFATAENVLSDCERYVPVRTGALRRSGQAAYGGSGGAVVEWGTDADTASYAREQYYGTGIRHTTADNPSNGTACAYWFEAAKAARGDAWAKVFKQTYEERA